MRILGLDVATRTGWVLLEDGKPEAYGLIELKGEAEHRDKLRKIRKEINIIVKEQKPDVIAIETVYVSTNPKVSALLNMLRGVILESIPKKIHIISVVNSSAKKLVLGKGNLKKEDVFNWAVSLYKLDDFEFKMHNDITDAILLATAGEIKINQE